MVSLAVILRFPKCILQIAVLAVWYVASFPGMSECDGTNILSFSLFKGIMQNTKFRSICF